MASKTIELNRSASSGSYIIGKIVCDSTADYDRNNSDVTCRIYVHKGNDSTQLTIPSSGTWSYSMSVGGKNFSGTVSKEVLLDWVLLATVSVSDIAHNDDGTKSISVSGSVTAPSVTNLAGHKTSGSGTFTLDAVPRASDITAASDVTLGYQCVVKWVPASASFRYRLKFSMGNWSYTTDAIHPNRTTEYTYTGYAIPLDAAHQIPNTRLGTMTVSLHTYSDGAATSQIGSANSKTFLVIVPDNKDTKPTVFMDLVPVGSLPSSFAGLYIQGLTKVKATLSAEGKYDASIASYLMRVDGVYLDADDAFTSDYFAAAGTRTVYGYATDKRGHTGEILKDITVQPYSNPKLEHSSAVRCDEHGNANESGTYLKISAKRNYSSLIIDGVQKNFCKIMYRYSDGLSYSAWETILDRTAGSDEVTTGALLGGGLAAQESYTVHVMAIDDIGRYAETYIVIPTEKVYMHRDGPRDAIGLGKYNERYRAVDSAWDFYMNGNRVTGLPMPSDDTDAVPMAYAAPADIEMRKSLNTQGWYKLGAISGGMCAVVTLTIGGIFVYNQASPSMVDIATEYCRARAFLRMPSLADKQLSKIGVIQESDTVYGVYAYYNSTDENTVTIRAHAHMGEFAPVDWIASSVSENDMLAVITLNE